MIRNECTFASTIRRCMNGRTANLLPQQIFPLSFRVASTIVLPCPALPCPARVSSWREKISRKMEDAQRFLCRERAGPVFALFIRLRILRALGRVCVCWLCNEGSVVEKGFSPCWIRASSFPVFISLSISFAREKRERERERERLAFFAIWAGAGRRMYGRTKLVRK